MPYINIQFIRDGVTTRQKQDLIAGVSRVIQDVLHKDPQRTHIVLQEIDTENWGVGGISVKAEQNLKKL